MYCWKMIIPINTNCCFSDLNPPNKDDEGWFIHVDIICDCAYPPPHPTICICVQFVRNQPTYIAFYTYTCIITTTKETVVDFSFFVQGSPNPFYRLKVFN